MNKQNSTKSLTTIIPNEKEEKHRITTNCFHECVEWKLIASISKKHSTQNGYVNTF